MADAAASRGYSYIAITDHAKGLKIAGGIDEQQLARQADEIAHVSKLASAQGVDVLRSIELNLAPDGTGDMEGKALQQLDLVLGRFHSALRRKEDQTERNLAALRKELAAWIECNILLQLASVPFDKEDETLVPAAGSCFSCPKRTGFNKLLFADVRKDSCSDPQCFRAKLDEHVARQVQKKPELVQISSAWNTREGAPLGRNRYVELQIKKAKPNGTGAKQPATQKPCEKMTDAIVMDGGTRGQIVKVCADPNCKVHHGDRPSPQQLQRDRQQERKRIEKEKIAITARHRILAAVLERVSAPLKKADLLTIAQLGFV